MLAGRCAESIPFAERAIESARTVGAQVIESRALNILGVDHANLGSIAAGIDLLRQSVAIALIVDDPIELPRSYANLGSMLEVGGFVEEALETSLAGAESTGRYGGELSFRWLLADERRSDAHRAGSLPGRPPSCWSRTSARPAGRQHRPPLQHVRPSAPADGGPRDRHPPSRASPRRGEQHPRRSIRHRAWRSGRRSRCGAATLWPRSRSLGKCWTDYSRWTMRSSSGSWSCPRCMPRRTSPFGPHGARPGRGQGRRRRRTYGGRGLSSRNGAAAGAG